VTEAPHADYAATVWAESSQWQVDAGIAKVAGFNNHRGISKLAEYLERRGRIRFTPGSFRTAHQFLVTTTVRSDLQLRLQTWARKGLNEALQRRQTREEGLAVAA
jgi:pyruvate carboxylase